MSYWTSNGKVITANWTDKEKALLRAIWPQGLQAVKQAFLDAGYERSEAALKRKASLMGIIEPRPVMTPEQRKEKKRQQERARKRVRGTKPQWYHEEEKTMQTIKQARELLRGWL